MELEAGHAVKMDQLLTETVTAWAEGQIDIAEINGSMALIRQNFNQRLRQIGRGFRGS